MAKRGEHRRTKPNSSDEKLSPMGKWRRKNKKRYQAWRKKYGQTSKSNSRNKARRLLSKSGRAKKCEKCGSTGYLEVHHKNGKVFDNRLSNLGWRCGKCNPRGHAAKKK